MQAFREGDRVKIVERTPTPADAKSGLYYSFFRGLTGTVFKIYGSGAAAQAAIDVDIESLPEEVARRHWDTRDRLHQSLPAEARRMQAAEAMHLRYVVLVGLGDVAKRAAVSRRAPANGGSIVRA